MRPKAMFILGSGSYSQIYGPEEVADIEKMCDVFCEPQTKESVAAHPELLAETEIIFSGWGAPKLDAAFLAAAPKLKAVFYGAGSVRGMVTDEMWDRGIIVTSSWAANAIPVSEYTLAEILFSLKLGWRWAYRAKADQAYPKKDQTVPGCYGSTIGLISLGMIGLPMRIGMVLPFLLKSSLARLTVRSIGWMRPTKWNQREFFASK